MDSLTTAEGIIAVVTANMARAIRVISVQRGHDPRDYTLVAFGGAGALHAARLAAELEIRRILAAEAVAQSLAERDGSNCPAASKRRNKPATPSATPCTTGA